MPSRILDFPIFDADNHMYETPDALTKHLDDPFKDVIKYIDIEGRTKITVKGTISEYIPNPTFNVVAAPGAQEEYFKNGNPDGKSRREILGKADPLARGVLRARAARQAHGRARHRPRHDVADPRQPRGGAPARRPVRHRRGDQGAQPLDVRAVVVQLRGPHLRHAGRQPRPARQRDRGDRLDASSTARRSSSSGRAPVTTSARDALDGAARVRPVLGARRRRRPRRRHARVRQRLPALHQRVGGHPRRRDAAVQGRLRLRRAEHHRPSRDRGHHRRRHRPRTAHAVPDHQDPPGRERQPLGAPVDRALQPGVRAAARSCSRSTRSTC